MAGIKFDIQEHCGVISESAKGWSKELNLVSWNNGQPKFDIRDWDPSHEKMGKGITLTNDELKELKRILNEMNL
ncbi:MAG: YdbC family protein [Peptostreptococcaceae bacterium]